MHISLRLFPLFILLCCTAFARISKKPRPKTSPAPVMYAPSFTLPDENRKPRSLHDFKGKRALCFYPKNGTPHSVRHFGALRDNYKILKHHNITIIGICYDSPTTSHAFKQKHNIPFPLLSDINHETTYKYGIYDPMLRKIEPKRRTVLIDKDGVIIGSINNIDQKNHHLQIIKKFQEYDAKKKHVC